jgi:hypothetical protein
MKIIGKIFLSLLAIFLTLILVGIILAKVFESKIIIYIIDELNNKLSSEVSVQNASFSLLRKFPDATISFKKVLISSGEKDINYSSSDTLLSADQIMLSFNILEILKGKYFLQDIQINSGLINVHIDNQGNGNYYFWHEKPGSGQENFGIDLQKVRIINSNVIFQDDATAVYVSFHSDKIELKGHFGAARFNMESNLQGTVETYRREKITYIKNQQITLNLVIEKLEDLYKINKAEIFLEKIHLAGKGEILQDQETIINMQIEGQDIRFGTVVRYLPELKNKIPSNLDYDGQFDILLGISGPVSKTKMPHIEVAFKIENAGVTYRKKNIQIMEINLSGVYNNGMMNNAASTIILVNNFSALYKNSTLSGSINLRNLLEPEVEYTLESLIDLKDIIDLTGKNTYHLNGYVNTKLFLKGKQEEILSLNRKDFNNLSCTGSIKVSNLQADLPDIPKFAREINASISIDKFISINRLTGNICNNELSISGRIDNFTEYFINHSGNLWADINLYSEEFVLDSIFALVNDPSERTESILDKLPDSLYIKLKFWFNHFGFSTFNGRNITGDLFYKPGILVVNHFSGSAMNGSIKVKGSLETQNKMKCNIRCNSIIDNVEIREVFTSFNNFGQDFIQERHIKGKLSGSIEFYGELDRNLNIVLPTILTDGDIVINDGELIGFEPMENLSKFIDLEELNHIFFSELRNEIYISKEKVIIPQMEINSSAINLFVSGIHGFDNIYNYKIKLSLSELLSNKLRSGKKNNTAPSISEDKNHGRTNIYLSIDGTSSDTKVSYDKEAAINGFKDKLKGEKKIVQSIVSEEFSKTEKDTKEQNIVETDSKPHFILDWSESEDSLRKRDTFVNKKKEKFILEWEEDTLR